MEDIALLDFPVKPRYDKASADHSSLAFSKIKVALQLFLTTKAKFH